MKHFLILILFTGSSLLRAQNVMIIHSAFSYPGDTVTLTVDITNSVKFVAFQFDLQLPQNVTFLASSLHLSNRSANHMTIGNMVGGNYLRIFTFSPDNAAFTGQSGEVISFSLGVGDIRGNFPLNLENGIIGDSLSVNILTGVENGILSVFPLGFNDQGEKKDDATGLTVFPNPIADHARVSFTVADFSAVSLIFYDQNGHKLISTGMGTFGKGRHTLELECNVLNQLKPGKMYCLEMYGKTKAGVLTNAMVKIIRIEH